MIRPATSIALVALGALMLGCGAGEGEGSVTSSHLVVDQCWSGPFNLQPTFFATIPFGDTQQIRIQRGDRIVEVSDGLLLVVEEVTRIRTEQLGKAIRLGLPVGVNPPGFPPRVEPDPPQVSLSLYLYDTCHVQNSALYAVDGSIVFESLFSGDRNENDAEARLTKAAFEARVADPRDAEIVEDPTTHEVAIEYPAESTSVVRGNFSFFFQRGVPAQPFP